MDMAGQSMVLSSFTGAFLHPPVPGSSAVNRDRHLYGAFQEWLLNPCKCQNIFREGAVAGAAAKKLVPAETSFLQWCRHFDVARQKLIAPEELDACRRPRWEYSWRVRNQAGRGANKACAVGVMFPFELLDIFIGCWAATFRPGQREEDIVPMASNRVPENMGHLAAVLQPFVYQGSAEGVWREHVEALILDVEKDLLLRGLGTDRVDTFRHRIRACARVLREVAQGLSDPSVWSARQIFRAPSRTWSPQQQLVLDAVERGTSLTDANDVALSERLLQVTGGPGTGKTEVVIAAALAAADRGCRVLVGAPVGLLVSTYRCFGTGLFFSPQTVWPQGRGSYGKCKKPGIQSRCSLRGPPSFPVNFHTKCGSRKGRAALSSKLPHRMVLLKCPYSFYFHRNRVLWKGCAVFFL